MISETQTTDVTAKALEYSNFDRNSDEFRRTCREAEKTKHLSIDAAPPPPPRFS